MFLHASCKSNNYRSGLIPIVCGSESAACLLSCVSVAVNEKLNPDASPPPARVHHHSDLLNAALLLRCITAALSKDQRNVGPWIWGEHVGGGT